MGLVNSFRFVDDDLNQQFIARLKEANISHRVGKDGIVYYSRDDEEAVENDCICSVCDRVFTAWQILTCPQDWTVRYKKYMSRHGIPFHEGLSNDELWLILPRKYQPHRWKLDSAMT